MTVASCRASSDQDVGVLSRSPQLVRSVGQLYVGEPLGCRWLAPPERRGVPTGPYGVAYQRCDVEFGTWRRSRQLVGADAGDDDCRRHRGADGACLVEPDDCCYRPGAGGEFLVVAGCAVGARHRLHHVQVADVGAPVAEVGLLIQDRVSLDGHGGRLLVAEAADPQPGVQLAESGGESRQVLPLHLDQAVAVAGKQRRSVGPGRVSTDDQVLDAVAVEGLDDAGEIKLGGLGQGPSPSRGASTPDRSVPGALGRVPQAARRSDPIRARRRSPSARRGAFPWC